MSNRNMAMVPAESMRHGGVHESRAQYGGMNRAQAPYAGAYVDFAWPPPGVMHYAAGPYGGMHPAGARQAPAPEDNGCLEGGCFGPDEDVLGTMTFVGHHHGEYVVDRVYRYVGPGEGSLTLSKPQKTSWAPLIAVVALLALMGIAMYHPWEQQQQAPLPEPPAQSVGPPRVLELPAIGECTFWGDPHLKSFDGARPSFYGEGEFYIVKTPTINIQGRYMGTEYTDGLAATNKIIVGGAFLRGHTVAVGDLEDGPIRIDGVVEPGLNKYFPSRYSLYELGNITYSAEMPAGGLVDQATAQWDKKIVTMELPQGVVIEVFRWTNYIDLRITMAPQQGQDGSCGNFNGNPDDDGDEDVFNRIGARVPEGQLLFGKRADEKVTPSEEELLARCLEKTPKLYSKAQSDCTRDLAKSYANPSTAVKKSCWLDICYGPREDTLALAKSLDKTLHPDARAPPPPLAGYAED